MPYKIAWYVPNRVLQLTFCGDLTINEILTCGDELTNLSLSASTSHYLLVDSREVGHFSFNLAELARSLNKFRGNPFIAWTLVISDNTLLKFANSVASKVTDTPTRTFSSLEEAYAFIAHNSPDLAPLVMSSDWT